MNFTEFNLNERLLEGLRNAGYTTCTEVQEQVLKNSQDGSDLYVQSQTGTGKTAAYLVAIIQELLSKDVRKKVLVLVPTRELAVQVEEEARTLAMPAGLRAYSFYGGVGYDRQIDAIKKGVDIMVSTPGRLIDLHEGGNLSLDDVGFLVCDEADRMFDMGFYPDLRKILKFLPKTEDRQTMLFSATLNTYVKNLAWEYTFEPKEIEIAANNITVSEIDQELLHVSSDDKMKLLVGILKNENPASVIIFCNTKRSCEVVSKRLEMNGIQAGFLIGDLPQKKRLAILKDFKEGKVTTLVATDVAARGIDVDDLAMVINYDLPNEAENYVHRIGRTARAGKSGKAYTFCSEQDVYNLPAIERFIDMQIPSKVAYPEQMLEDKSAGVYIRTQDWRDDDDEQRSGRRERDSYRKGYRKDGKKGDFKSGEYRKDGKKGGFKKNEKTKDGYRKDSKKSFSNGEDFKKLETMSADERMKYYKEKYASLKDSRPRREESGPEKSKKGSKSSYGRSVEKNLPKSGKKDFSKSGPKSGSKNGKKNYEDRKDREFKKKGGKKDLSKNRNFKDRGQVVSESRKEPSKKGLISRIRSFFGR